ncbi:phosphate ABC transporter substrate-binding protein [Bifidobacterium pseudolongum subsp. globosum]|jgi:phosphate transport system substrate-binding protein|uniref:Phosphate-binding protein n=1 Tax=Bifidobacterium pseudolongum subsp. globosum TaxID=1690 RepID=A0A4Q5A7G2_9BIFI|nr:phosphate ABC transporter substrate-binding protein PstS [Bifidobacterium pseudolongum]MCH4842110.1 phosphate ABC transporter substrate-binding protein PstS [Bifidobacterium pseudolongum]MCH4850932.1 phosphate ABC transporter substrate-binding protein PstS [Bifidobacterium pseudolongum]MCH4856023.1 phosphate ABC transporter substrate-binding protein PstS [Bifidobacterium pseudolongum]MCH4859641.1 phosphate ABC transporter substrate-binding protein PstS [Bifidobacterium pseudolongum]MCH48614
MNNHMVTRSLAAVCGVGLLASLAACGDNTAAPESTSATKDGVASLTGEYAGAGASSQQTAVEAWIEGFRSQAPNATVAYNPSGSGAGVSTFLTGSTVWAGSDKALSAEEIEQSKSVCASGTAFDVPVYVSPIAVAFNLDGISTAGKHVNMDAATIAKVFNGEITRWNDPAITEQNPGLDLPNLTITVVHRSDKSGTTLNFVSYLKDVAPSAWPHDLSENWPNEVGQGAKGTSGVVSTIKQANGTIGYADFSQVGDLGTIAVKVGDDYTPISADAASKVIADSPVDTSVDGDNRIVIDINHKTAATGAYPIVLVSYDIVCPAYKESNDATFAKAWLTYVTSAEGQKAAQDAAGTAPLPSNLTGKITASIDQIKVG